MFFRPPLRWDLPGLVLLLFIATLSAASARPIPDDPPGTVRFCVQTDSRLARLVPADDACRSTESLVVVSIQGPPGPPGPGLETGAITGRLTADCFRVTSGEVYLAGHSFSARVDSSGDFTLHWVPAGTYTLNAPLARPLPIDLPVTVASGATTNVGDLKVQSVETDVMNCGACMHPCSINETCEDGICACPAATPVRCEPTPWRPYPLCLPAGSVCPVCAPGLTSCNGLCVDTQWDVNHCGTCGNSCGAGMCVAGTCTMMPPPPTGPCPGMVQCPNGTCAMSLTQCSPQD